MFDKKSAIIDIDDDSKGVYLDTYKLKKNHWHSYGPGSGSK